MPIPHAIYGRVPPELASDDVVVVPGNAVQCSPLVPPSGAIRVGALSDMEPASLKSVSVHAPASTVERRRVLALSIRALAPGGLLLAFAANGKGGTRIGDELAAFGLKPDETSKRHHRIIRAIVPTQDGVPLNLPAINQAIVDGEPRLVPGLLTPEGEWSMPGLFNWDTLDTGSALLLANVPALAGRGIDLGCGIGVLAKAILSRGACTAMALADIDRRALDLACRNVSGVAATTGGANSAASISAIWTDVRTTRELPTGLDFVIMNPPFHDGATEDRTLGQAFITRAAQILRPGGQLWMTANRHLPYEATLTPLFERVETIAQSEGFKVTSARKPTKPMRDRAIERVGSKVGGAFGRKAEPVTPLIIDGYVIDDDNGERRKSKRGGKNTDDMRTPAKGKSVVKTRGTGRKTSGGVKPVRSRPKS